MSEAPTILLRELEAQNGFHYGLKTLHIEERKLIDRGLWPDWHYIIKQCWGKGSKGFVDAGESFWPQAAQVLVLGVCGAVVASG